MSGKPLTNISNGKTGDSRGLQASGATLCRRGWQSRGAEKGSRARLAGTDPARPCPGQATSGQ